MLLHWYRVVLTGGKQYSILHNVICLRLGNALEVKTQSQVAKNLSLFKQKMKRCRDRLDFIIQVSWKILQVQNHCRFSSYAFEANQKSCNYFSCTRLKNK